MAVLVMLVDIFGAEKTVPLFLVAVLLQYATKKMLIPTRYI